MLANLYDKTVSTKRLAAVASTNKETWQDNLVDLPCTIHPVETSQQNLNDGAFYKTFKLWCELGTDIVIGDRIIEGATTYTVKGVSIYDFGRNAHLRVTMVVGA